MAATAKRPKQMAGSETIMTDVTTGGARAAGDATCATATPEQATPVLDTSCDKSQLLAILSELRSSVGDDVVNAAIQKVMQAKNALNAPPSTNKRQKKGKKGARGPRAFQMDRYATRKVAVKFLYLGERYDGFARQDHTDATVERHMISALVHTKLIKDIDSCEYSRCGRTDKGVSAFGQVIGLTVRSNMPVGAELLSHDNVDAITAGEKFQVRMTSSGELRQLTEVDYAVAINRALPEDIRVFSVVSAPSSFSARFDCQGRMYRYFFVKNQLDIEAMRVAAAKLVGTHDFRNFCRIDTSKHTFERVISSFEIVPCDTNSKTTAAEATDDSQQLYRFEIRGRAFLWHQVRCMVQVLFHVGEGHEDPSVVDALLDIAHMPRKPQYDMASDAPLCLQDCFFRDQDVTFQYTPLAMYHVYNHVQALWERAAIKTALLRSDLEMLAQLPVSPSRVVSEMDHFAPKLEQLMQERGLIAQTQVPWHLVAPLLPMAAKNRFQPLLTRLTGNSVDEAKQQMKERKRRRLEMDAAAKRKQQEQQEMQQEMLQE